MNILNYLPEEFKQVNPDLIEMINNAFVSHEGGFGTDYWAGNHSSIAETLIHTPDSVSFTMSSDYVTIAIAANKHKVVISFNSYSSSEGAIVIYATPEIETE